MEEKVKARIVIDDRIRHGKPIIKGTRITVDEVLGALIGGMNYEEIEREYGIEKEDILAVIEYTASFVRDKEIRPLGKMQKYREIFNQIETTLREESSLSTELFDSHFGKFKNYENQSLSDDEYFSKMVAFIFYSGFRAETVTKKLDTIISHFPDYKTVANYGETEIHQILSNPRMIRNPKKIKACIKNAKIFKEIVSEHGSFDRYVKSFEPCDSFENLMLFKEEIEYKFAFLGGITVYHFMMDIGLPVMKPDRVITRIFKRLELIENEKQYLKTVIQGRKFSHATGHPIRYIDIIFVKYGQKGEEKYFGLMDGICLEKNPKCMICGVKKYCGYADNSR